MELLDVFTDIETPQTSEDEEDVPVQFPSPSTTKAKTMYNKILHAPMMPSRPTAYDERYLDAKYRKNVSKKYKKMMKKVSRDASHSIAVLREQKLDDSKYMLSIIFIRSLSIS
jgi:hypothetical protein